MNRYNLLKNLSEKCIKTGDFTLNSGKKTNIYFDKYEIFSSSEMVNACVDQMINLLFSNDDAYLHQFAAPALGGALLATAIQQKLSKLCPNTGLIIVRDQKDHGIQSEVLGGFEKGNNVVIIEDVITSGKAVTDTIKRVLCYPKNRINIVQIIALVDRHGAGVRALREDGYNVSTVFTFDEIVDSKPPKEFTF